MVVDFSCGKSPGSTGDVPFDPLAKFPEFGMLPFLFGTLFTAAIAVAISVPVSLGVALFITQVAPPWLKKPLVYVTDLLAVVPSVVFGLWGILVLAPTLGRSFLTDEPKRLMQEFIDRKR